VLGEVTGERRRGSEARRRRQQRAGAKRRHRERRECAQVLERRPDRRRARTFQSPRERPRPQHRDERDAHEQWPREQQHRRAVAGQRRAGGEHRQPRGEQGAAVATSEQRGVRRRRRGTPHHQRLQQREPCCHRGELGGDEEHDGPERGRCRARLRGVDERERRAARREHADRAGERRAHAAPGGHLGVERRRDLGGRSEPAYGLVLAALRGRVVQMVAALAQEAPARGSAHVQRRAQLGEISLDGAHAADPSTRSTAAENTCHSRRDSRAARSPPGVS
jgi:hypothetical protein